METIYRAFDGKEFDDEDDCLDYEHRQKCRYILFDGNMDQTSNDCDAWYMILRNEDDIDYVKSECFCFVCGENIEINVPYYWDEALGGFARICEKIDELKHEISRLKEARSKLLDYIETKEA